MVQLPVGFDTSSFDNDLRSMTSAVMTFSNVASQSFSLAGAAIAGGFAVAANKLQDMISQSIDDLREFEDNFTAIKQLMDVGQSTELVKQQIRDLSITSGRDLNEVAVAFESIFSVDLGYAAEDLAGLADKLGLAIGLDLNTAAIIGTRAMNAFGYELDNVSEAMDIVSATIDIAASSGEVYASVMGRMSGIAAGFNVNLVNMNAIWASLEKGGLEASEAATGFTQLMSQVGRSGTEAARVFREATGRTLTEFAEIMGGDVVPGLIQMMSYMEQTGLTAEEVFGSEVRALSAFSLLSTEEGIRNVTQAVAELNDSLGVTALKAMTAQESLEWQRRWADNIGQRAVDDAADYARQFLDSLSKAWSFGLAGNESTYGALAAPLGTLLEGERTMKAIEGLDQYRRQLITDDWLDPEAEAWVRGVMKRLADELPPEIYAAIVEGFEKIADIPEATAAPIDLGQGPSLAQRIGVFGPNEAIGYQEQLDLARLALDLHKEFAVVQDKNADATTRWEAAERIRFKVMEAGFESTDAVKEATKGLSAEVLGVTRLGNEYFPVLRLVANNQLFVAETADTATAALKRMHLEQAAGRKGAMSGEERRNANVYTDHYGDYSLWRATQTAVEDEPATGGGSSVSAPPRITPATVFGLAEQLGRRFAESGKEFNFANVKGFISEIIAADREFEKETGHDRGFASLMVSDIFMGDWSNSPLRYLFEEPLKAKQQKEDENARAMEQALADNTAQLQVASEQAASRYLMEQRERQEQYDLDTREGRRRSRQEQDRGEAQRIFNLLLGGAGADKFAEMVPSRGAWDQAQFLFGNMANNTGIAYATFERMWWDWFKDRRDTQLAQDFYGDPQMEEAAAVDAEHLRWDVTGAPSARLFFRGAANMSKAFRDRECDTVAELQKTNALLSEELEFMRGQSTTVNVVNDPAAASRTYRRQQQTGTSLLHV